MQRQNTSSSQAIDKNLLFAYSVNPLIIYKKSDQPNFGGNPSDYSRESTFKSEDNECSDPMLTPFKSTPDDDATQVVYRRVKTFTSKKNQFEPIAEERKREKHGSSSDSFSSIYTDI